MTNSKALLLCSRFAEITILAGSVVPIWITLCMTEAIAIKAAMATKFKYVGGINDDFFGHFLFVANLGFATVSAFGMYHLNSLQLDIMIFSGEWIKTEPFDEIFWPVFLSATFLVTGISGIVLNIKKNVEKKKDQRILNNICVNLNMTGDATLKFNNNKFNQPILKNIETFALGLTVIGIVVVFLILEWMKSNTFIWFILVVYFVINILLPCNGLRKRDHFNAFVWRTLHDLWNYLHTVVTDLSRHIGKTQKIIRPTDISLVAESDAIPMPTAYQTPGRSHLELPPVEDTPAADIIFVVEANAIPMPTAYQTLGQFLQEMPTVEDAPANTLAADALAADTPAADAPVADSPRYQRPHQCTHF